MKPGVGGVVVGWLLLLSGTTAGAQPVSNIRIEELVPTTPDERPSGTVYRVRAQLSALDAEGVRLGVPLRFWRDVQIREVGYSSFPPNTVCAANAGEAAEEGQPAQWRVIMLVDTSLGMSRGKPPRYRVALQAAESFFEALEGVDVQLAVQSYDCVFAWKEKYLDGTVRWSATPAEMKQSLVPVRRRVEGRRPRDSNCTSLYNAVSEADLALEAWQSRDPTRRSVLVVLGHGKNDLANPPAAVWVASGQPARPDPERPFTPARFIPSPEELQREARRRGDLKELLDLIEQAGVTLEDPRLPLSREYTEFTDRLQGRGYLRWAVAVGPGSTLSDQTLQALAGATGDYRRTNDARSTMSTLGRLAGRMAGSAVVSFPSRASTPLGLNEARWEFAHRGRLLGRYGPELIVPPVGTPSFASRGTWEAACYGATCGFVLCVLVPFGLTLAFLAIVWLFGAWAIRSSAPASP